MRCEYCLREDGHNSRCPKYVPQKPKYYCSICGEGIYDGEEYIKNDDGEYAHLDCFYTIRKLVNWLGYEVEIMYDDEND